MGPIDVFLYRCLNPSVLAVFLTDKITLISKDEVEGSTVSKNEADQVKLPCFN